MKSLSQLTSFLRLILGLFFFFSGIAYLRAKWFQRKQPLVRVLLVHHMRSAERFERMIKFLALNHRVVSFEDFVQKRFVKNKINILLTFDDGYESWHSVGVPILQKYQVSPVAFIVSGFVTNKQSLEEQKIFAEEKLHLPTFSAPLNWQMVCDLRQAGWEIGGHTCSHPFLSTVDVVQAEMEVQKDKEQIEEHLSEKMRVFAYPFGDYTKRDVELVKQAGYEFAFTTTSDFCFHEQELFEIPRSNHGTVSPFMLRLWIWGAFDLAFSVQNLFVSLIRSKTKNV